MMMEWKFLAAIILAFLSIACGSEELPVESRYGARKENGNADLRLPSNTGGKPDQRSRWWDGGKTQYPNSGYYSSESR